MLVFGVACAIYANAVRTALLYLGAAELIAVPLHRHETFTGLFCFTASALMLLAAAAFLAGRGQGGDSQERPQALGWGLGPRPKVMAAYSLLCAAFFFISLNAPAQAPAPSGPPEAITWPAVWESRPLIPEAPSPETEKFWRGFPGAYREFVIAGPETAAGAGLKRVVMRLVTQPNGRVYTVRQCVIAAKSFDLSMIEESGGGRAWPDVSSWYWDVARPGAEISPLALAVTVIAAQK